MVKRRIAFTLLEVLVILAVIAILVALLLPAVQQARNAGGRTECASRLRQIGIGFHNFQAAKGTVPIPHQSIGHASASGTPYVSWRLELLPFL